jgi:hypothetical protein
MDGIDTHDHFLKLRRCLREPISPIFEAAHLLDRAVGAHLQGDMSLAREFIELADIPEVKAWTESLWGSAVRNPEQWRYIRLQEVSAAAPHLRKADRVAARMPTEREKQAIIARWGYNCAFCGIPVIRSAVRAKMRVVYGDVLRWEGTNATQHAAFECMWLQFDHVLPHARGGGNDLQNVIVTCAPCNYGRMNWTLDEVGLLDPRSRPPCRTSWDGLERFTIDPVAP